MLMRLYLRVRRSGLFVPSLTGGILPFPFAWQAWLIFVGLIVLLALTIMLPVELGWLCRIGLCVGYIAFGMLTYDGT